MKRKRMFEQSAYAALLLSMLLSFCAKQSAHPLPCILAALAAGTYFIYVLTRCAVDIHRALQ